MTLRITSSHSLSEAILLKKDNQQVSAKTLSKIAEKLTAINQRFANKPTDYIECMKAVSQSLDTVKNDTVYVQLQTVIKQHSAHYFSSYTSQLRFKAKCHQKINLNEVYGMELVRQSLLKSRPAQPKFVKNVSNVSSKAQKIGVKKKIAVSEQIKKQKMALALHRNIEEAMLKTLSVKTNRHLLNEALLSSLR